MFLIQIIIRDRLNTNYEHTKQTKRTHLSMATHPNSKQVDTVKNDISRGISRDPNYELKTKTTSIGLAQKYGLQAQNVKLSIYPWLEFYLASSKLEQLYLIMARYSDSKLKSKEVFLGTNQEIQGASSRLYRNIYLDMGRNLSSRLGIQKIILIGVSTLKCPSCKLKKKDYSCRPYMNRKSQIENQKIKT